ncbi:hypothetical protein FB451DRAFT_1068108 [Mycena latifolia]|nr:hypothetical protein FB451DRAFT_1068108 [Mycena latifolia]
MNKSSVRLYISFACVVTETTIEHLRKAWRSPVYNLYKAKVAVGYEGERKYHRFDCSNKRCKLGKHGKPGSVRRYLDSKDRSATGNLINHAKACRGNEAVQNSMGAKNKTKGFRDGSIYAAFARLGNRVRSFSHRPHMSQETSEHFLIKTGRPSTYLPSPRQVARDVHAVFELCQARIANLLQEHVGNLSFSTDAWTSPNHRTIVGWVVHLQHQGKALSFLLDIKELPESHTGEALSRAFQEVLEDYGIANKVCFIAYP